MQAAQAEAEFLSTLPARGATETKGGYVAIHLIFLSTLPARGATTYLEAPPEWLGISIHAPREGSDSSNLDSSSIDIDFYPRSP